MQINLTENFEFLFRPKTFKILFGGRYGMKTIAAIRALLVQGGQRKLRIMGCREYMKSIESSVHEAMCGEINKLHLNSFYTYDKSSITGANGTKVFYAGLARDPKGLKSTYDLDRALLEEGESVSEKSLDDLIPTIIREEGSELWVIFNPEDELAPVWQRFVAPYIDQVQTNGYYEDDRLYVLKTSYYENPFLSKEAFEEAEKMKVDNYKKWLWQFGGELYSDFQDSIIKPEWIDAAINSHIRLGWKPLGVKSTGFDLADTGDAKALAHRHGSLVYDAENWEWGELPEAIDHAFRKCGEHGSDYQVYDDDGLGRSMKVYLANTGPAGVKVDPFNGNAAVDNPNEVYIEETRGDGTTKIITNKDHFKNKRAQYYGGLADRFEATYNAVEKGVYTDPNDMISLSKDLPNLNILKSQLSKIKRKRSNNTQFQVQSKQDAKKEGIKSPNDADSLMMCFANPAVSKKEEPIQPQRTLKMPLA